MAGRFIRELRKSFWSGSISKPVIVSGAFVFQRRFSIFNMNAVNINETPDVAAVNTDGL
jgi:hypothetical protein